MEVSERLSLLPFLGESLEKHTHVVLFFLMKWVLLLR